MNASVRHKLKAGNDESLVAFVPICQTEFMTEKAPKIETNSSPKPSKQSPALLGYAITVTVLLLLTWATRGLPFSGNSTLESLPDVKPLQPGEFQLVPQTAALPAGHELRLGETQRFGDVEITPTQVVVEPVEFVHMTGRAAPDKSTAAVLKLYFTAKNVSQDMKFPPYDVELMCSRTPRHSQDAADAKANSWLMCSTDSGDVRGLNFYHPLDSEYDLVGQNSRKAIAPGETMTTFVAVDTVFVPPASGQFRWRLQLRKGLHRASGNSVTTLVDVVFDAADIAS